jgi:hypothetical protein
MFLFCKMEIKWFRKLNNGHDSLLESCSVPEGSIIVRNESEGIQKFTFFRTTVSLFDYWNSLEIPMRCLNEIIRSNAYQKPYFDLDMEYISNKSKGGTTCDEKRDIIKRIPDIISAAIIDLFPEIKKTDILILSSHGDKPGQMKRSLHIIVDRWCFINSKQNKIFHEEVMKRIPQDLVQFFDSRVHSENQSFRMYNSVKHGQTRKMIYSKILNLWMSDEELTEMEDFNRAVLNASLITNVGDCNIIVLEESEGESVSESIGESVSEESKVFKLTSSDISLLNNIIDPDYFSIYRIKNNIVELKRLLPSYCEHCDAEHEHDNPFLIICSDRSILLNCRKKNKYTKVGVLE